MCVSRKVAAISAFVLSLAVVGARSSARISPEDRGPALIELSQPVYPPLAKAAGISGDVELVVSVGPDGRIDSVSASSGPQLLRQAALESAQQSRYECTSCTEALTSAALIYSFRLEPANCGSAVKPESKSEPAQDSPQVSRSQNRVTIVDRGMAICDPAGVKVRSVRCLFLWKCGVR
jgi:TonB family protein